jgi:hypothetical protein
LNGFESSITTFYGIRSTPNLTLIDGQGRILDRNVHPTKLGEKLKQYLGSSSSTGG